MNQTTTSRDVLGADKITCDGITYEIVERRPVDERGGQTIFVRRPNGRRFYLGYLRNGFARVSLG